MDSSNSSAWYVPILVLSISLKVMSQTLSLLLTAILKCSANWRKVAVTALTGLIGNCLTLLIRGLTYFAIQLSIFIEQRQVHTTTKKKGRKEQQSQMFFSKPSHRIQTYRMTCLSSEISFSLRNEQKCVSRKECLWTVKAYEYLLAERLSYMLGFASSFWQGFI